ncbi:MAG: nicotinate (nicotinamide) nucleotide adenylyltransferase [Simkaniaceae bacterium]|jgi:nicotinate-nucleotide adenylyltransferase|nr:MAG: nicotinate (nicotinamide) nucleotide adenylyltransferase [Simkaniaceae bacterium]
MTTKKIGFFGGSFDPVHLGHINLAIRVLEKGLVDQILFCPAHISPTKGATPPIAEAKHRMNMLQLALEDVPGCDPYEEEVSRPPPSFTIDSIKELKGDIRLIVAEDTAYGFKEWKEVDILLEMAPPIVGVRHGFDREKLNDLPEKIKLKVEAGMIEIPAMDISSSEIRERLKKRLYCGHLLQGKVLDYIHQNTIY